MEEDKKQKFWQKKLGLFGKQISVLLVVGLVVAAGATAALVSYLSNEAKAEVTVESPFEVKNTIGLQESTSENSVTGITWEDDSIIEFGTLYGGETMYFTNYIKNRAEATIPVNDYEKISGENGSGALTMDALNDQFSFFGARYWRPEGTPNAGGGLTRLADYDGDIDKGWDPYTYNNSGTIECYGPLDAETRNNNIESNAWVTVRDGICYYTDAAFSFAVVGDDLVSDYPYEHYVGGFEEVAQYVVEWASNTAPGDYTYMRQIMEYNP